MASDVDHIVPTLPKNFAHQRANILVEHQDNLGHRQGLKVGICRVFFEVFVERLLCNRNNTKARRTPAQASDGRTRERVLQARFLGVKHN
jgi:hypothetical protein